MSTDARLRSLNQFALLLALGVFAALGVAWWRDRLRPHEPPRWDAGRFVELAPSAAPVTSELWLVAVNLRCPHCTQHLAVLADSLRTRVWPPVLGALLVDQPARPERLDLAVPLTGGVWWDSTQVWREKWRRRVYGETFRFEAGGRLISSTPAGVVPDIPSSRM